MRTWERHEYRTPSGVISYLKWERAGRDAPWLHFAHGNGMNSQTYAGMLEPLADRLNIVAWDARGHGLTTLEANPDQLRQRGWQLYQEDLEDFLEYLDRPLFLAGHSMGAVLSLFVAASKPWLAQRVVLVDPVILPPLASILWGTAKLLGRNNQFPIVRQAAHRRSHFESRQAVVDSYRGRGGFRTWMCGDCLEAYVEGGTRELPDGSVELACNPLWESASFSQMSEWSFRALRRLQRPATIVYGSQSDAFPRATAKAVRLLMPHIRLVPFKDAGHFVPMEEPLRVGEELVKGVMGP